jgi:hypothetical protein
VRKCIDLEYARKYEPIYDLFSAEHKKRLSRQRIRNAHDYVFDRDDEDLYWSKFVIERVDTVADGRVTVAGHVTRKAGTATEVVPFVYSVVNQSGVWLIDESITGGTPLIRF